MATVLTKAIIQNATAAVDTYVTTANNLYQDLDSKMTQLIGTDFAGEAANGFKVFFDTQVKPALADNLTAHQGSLMAGVKSILEGIDKQLMQTVDPQLGKNNENPGGGQ